MSEEPTSLPVFKPKKSVALSGTPAGNTAALRVYEAIRGEGTQAGVVGMMQTREELYAYLDYHAYERKLDELFAKGKE